MGYGQDQDVEIPAEAVDAGELEWSGGKDPAGRAQLVEALAAAQGEIVPAERDRRNEHLGSSYSTLCEAREVGRIPLSKNGIALIQGPKIDGGHVSVRTELAHKSGQWVASTLRFKTEYMKGLNAMQVVGSAISYARRYTLMALTGVVVKGDPDDDDAEAIHDGRGDRDARPPAAPKLPMPTDYAALKRMIGEAESKAVLDELWRMGRYLPFKLEDWQAVEATNMHKERRAYLAQTVPPVAAPPAATTKPGKMAEDIKERSAKPKNGKPAGNISCKECNCEVWLNGFQIDTGAVKAPDGSWLCGKCTEAAEGGA